MLIKRMINTNDHPFLIKEESHGWCFILRRQRCIQHLYAAKETILIEIGQPIRIALKFKETFKLLEGYTTC